MTGKFSLIPFVRAEKIPHFLLMSNDAKKARGIIPFSRVKDDMLYLFILQRVNDGGGGKDKAASCVQIRRSYELFKNRIITHENDYNREFCRAQLNRFLLRRRGETS